MALYRIRIGYSGTPVNGPSVSTFHFQSEVQEPQDAVDSLSGVFDAWKANMVSQLTIFAEPEVETIDPATGDLLGLTAVTTWTKTGSVGSASALPNAVMGLIRWRTGVFIGGKEVRGRTFLPGFASGFVTADGNVPSAQLTSMTTGANLWRDAGDNASVVYSRVHGVAHPIISASPWNEYATLRSRRD